MFAKDDKGNDWYDLSKTLDKSKYTIMLCRKNVVRSFGKDPIAMFPVIGGSVLQVEELGNIDYLSTYDPETQTFTPYTPKPNINQLLNKLKVAEIKKELGDNSVDQEIKSLKRQIVEIS